MNFAQKILDFIKSLPSRFLSARHFTIFLALIVGSASGLVAVLLKNSIHYFGIYVLHFFSAEKGNFLLLLLPLIGIILTFLFVKYFVKDEISHGVSRVLQAISTQAGYLKASKMYSSFIASTLTIGFGGSVGPEAPVVLTGSAIGSNIGRFFKVDYKTLVLLIACGATGAVAGIFSAPIAGLIFALEVLMIDLTLSSVIPLLIAALSASTISALLTGSSAMFFFSVEADFAVENLPFYLILGLVSGLISHYFLHLSESIEILFSKIKNHWTKVLFGGFAVSILIFFFPPLYGEGFAFLSDIFNGHPETLVNNSFFYSFQNNTWIFLLFVFILVFLKVIAMALTNGSGGVGGVFAPSMFIGGVLGFFVARLLNTVFGLDLPEANFALAGMAGVMSGVMHAPLTAIFLIAEVTSGYRFFIPLMLVSSSAYLLSNYFNPHSIYTKKLAEKGELFTHNKDTVVLSLMSMKNLIEKNFISLKPSQNLGDLVHAISISERNLFPVLNEKDDFLGVVFFSGVKHLIFKPELYDTVLIKDLIFMPPYSIDIHDSMEATAQLFLKSEEYNIVVLDGKKYIGFLSRANVFSMYRSKIKELSND